MSLSDSGGRGSQHPGWCLKLVGRRLVDFGEESMCCGLRELCRDLMSYFPFKEVLSKPPEIPVAFLPHDLSLFLLEFTGGVAFEPAMGTEQREKLDRYGLYCGDTVI